MSEDDITKDTRAHYESLISDVGGKYLQQRWFEHPVSCSQYYQTQRSIDRLFADKITTVNDLLEIGSGPGTWTDIFKRHANHVTLFDISEEFLKVVKRKYSDTEDSMDFICGDFVADSDKLEKMYDVIVTVRAFEYMSDKDKVVLQCYERLKPGGHLAIITKNPMWRDKVRDKAENTIHRKQIHWSKLEEIFVNSGFKEILIRPVALGSYYQPYSNVIGIGYCNMLQKLICNKKMHKMFDSVTESYLIYGRK